MKDENEKKTTFPPKEKTDKAFHFLYYVIWPFFNLVRPVKAIGRENIPDGPAVICPNHSTIGDPFYVCFGFGRRYPMRAIAKMAVLKVPFIGWILGKAGVFGVDRGSADVKAVKTSLHYLKEGSKLLIFPEGTRVRDGEEVEAKTGAVLFATRTNTPILPVYVPRKKKLFRVNTIVIGTPYYAEFEGRRPTTEELKAITDDLMERIYKLGEGQE